MAVAKIYNSQTGQWEAVIVGTTGDTGVVQSATEPSNTDQLWLDTDDTAEPLAIPAGGSAGQILQKSTDGDYDTAWSNVPSHNYIINGGFDIWQRGTSFTGISSATYVADRWLAGPEAGSVMTATRQTNVEVAGLGIVNTLKVEFTTAASGGGSNVFYKFSADEINTDFAGKTMKLSLYARANRNFNVVSTGFFFPAGSNFGSDTYALTTSWQRFSTTISFPADVTATGTGWYQILRDITNAQVGDWWEIAGVQLEAGSVATPFKRNAPSLQGELAACQRYFLRLGDTGGTYILGNSTNRSTTQTYLTRALPTTMRSSPTLQDKEISVAYAKGNSWNNLSLTDLTLATSAQESVTFIGEVASGLVAGEASAILFGSSDYVDLDAEL